MDRTSRRLRTQARALAPALSVGKNGVTEGVVRQLDEELERKTLVKVKLLRTFLEGKDRQEEARRLATLSDARLIDVIGGMVVLHRAKKEPRRAKKDF